MMVVLKCPNCNASLEFDAGRQFAFCQYCGTKIANIPQRVDVTYDRSGELQNLLLRAREYEMYRDFARAWEYCSRALDIDPGNREARSMEARLASYRRTPNVVVYYRTAPNNRNVLRITMDGCHWQELWPGQQTSLHLPVGKHRMLFSGTKSYSRDIVVTDVRRVITVVYTADGRNTIEMFER